MASDIVQGLLEAVVTILRGDSTIVAELGRSDRVVQPWQSLDATPLPALFYVPVGSVQRGGTGDTRLIEIQFTAIAEGPGSQAKANAIIERVEVALSQPALAGQGVDAAPYAPWSRRFIPPYGTTERDGGRALYRSDLDTTFIITK